MYLILHCYSNINLDKNRYLIVKFKHPCQEPLGLENSILLYLEYLSHFSFSFAIVILMQEIRKNPAV